MYILQVYKLAKFTTTYRDGKATLTLSNTDPTDSGVYRCEAYNAMGRVYTEGKVTVCSTYL